MIRSKVGRSIYIKAKNLHYKIISNFRRSPTGCDSGFGELLSKRLSQKGFRVISGCLTANGIQNLENIVTKAVLCDVTKEKDLQQLAKDIEKISQQANSRVWAVINNAGIADGGALDWTEVKIWKKVMEVNFFAVVGMIRTMLPFLKRTPGSRYTLLLTPFPPLPLSSPYLVLESSTYHPWRGLWLVLEWEPIVLLSMLWKEWQKLCVVN